MIKKHLLFIISIIISLLLFGTNQQGRLERARFLGKTVYYPFFSFLNRVKSNQKLSQQNLELQKKLLTAQKENAKLNIILNKAVLSDFCFKNDDYDFILAEVISYTGTFKERNILINKGQSSKIENNMPVINHKGVVGKITQTSIANSVILPITHSRFRLAVMSKRMHIQGILKADADGNLFMNYIPLESDIAIGDEIVSSGISSIFPKNIAVGKVVQIKNSDDKAYIKAKIKPFADILNLENVAIISYKEQGFDYEKQNYTSEQ